jgi:hypothetical protein
MVLLVGCQGESHPLPAATEPSAAVESLTQALDAWRAGGTPNAFMQSHQNVTIRDEDWQQGTQLVNFNLSDPPQRYGHDIRLIVHLTLKSAKAATLKKVVRYTVATEPQITILRDDTLD